MLALKISPTFTQRAAGKPAHNKSVEEKQKEVSCFRQAYEMFEINLKLQSEIDDMKSKWDNEKKSIQCDYEKKLDKLKAEMVIIITALMRGGGACVY